MLLETVFSASLVIQASLTSRTPPLAETGVEIQLSVRQKHAAMLPVVTRATECIARRVSADRRYSAQLRTTELNDLIVDAMSACERPLRAMIETHDRMYGRGSGEAFLLGPYLDVLPAAVARQASAPSRAQ